MVSIRTNFKDQAGLRTGVVEWVVVQRPDHELAQAHRLVLNWLRVARVDFLVVGHHCSLSAAWRFFAA
jgi:hypothetical protein